MIEEQAEVLAVEGDQVIVRAQRQSACGACSANKGCGTAVLSKVVGQKFTTFSLKNTHQAKQGDLLLIGIEENAMLSSSALAYLLPLLFMFISGLFALWLGQILNLTGEGHVILGSISGLGAGILLLNWKFNKNRQNTALQPKILRKIQQVSSSHGTILLP